MSEFEEKLSAILGNPDAMGQIMNIAKSLGGGAPTGDGLDHGEGAYGDVPFDASSPPSMDGFMPILEQIDPKLIGLAMGLMSEYNAQDDDRAALLAALRPYLRKKRYKKLDRAVQIAKLSRLIRVAVGAFQGGDGDV